MKSRHLGQNHVGANSSGQTVGLDIGLSTVAIVADDAVRLEKFAASVEQPWKAMRVLQRAQDRSRRATNPGNYESSGVPKKGAKRWLRSERYQTRQVQLSELERCLAAARKRDHGELVNKILGLGNCIQIEKLSYKGLQKNFGRSAKVRASGMFVSLLTRKSKLRTIMGRLQREVGRKMSALGLAVQEALGNTLSQAQRLISQTASRKTPGKQGKLYN